MPSFGDLVGRSLQIIQGLGSGLRSRPKRLFAIFLLSFYCTLLLPVLSLGHLGFGEQVAYAQVPGTIANQASASVNGAAAIPSNTTTITTAVPSFSIVKTADRGAAEPGDVVTYRLLVTNNSAIAINNLTVTDQLPLGVQLVQGSFRSAPVNPVATNVQGRSFTLQFTTLAGSQSLEIVYAAVITPDAIRGSGRNTAAASAPGVGTVSSSFQLAIRPGIVADCGTIVGRVFVDKNFDGHQQDGEPGVPNAVIYLDSGNRILTDPDGLFSLINVLSGPHVGTIDLSSLPGYTLAPNLYWLADNSVSRLVRLEPGGLARMNFAVTPTFGEGQSE
jgi:uncharacterized repeat protein (TIGR01451 family)